MESLPTVCHEFMVNVGKYSVHGAYGVFKKNSPPKSVHKSHSPQLEYQRLHLPDASHHQNDITCLVGNLYKPSFSTATGWGVDPIYRP